MCCVLFYFRDKVILYQRHYCAHFAVLSGFSHTFPQSRTYAAAYNFTAVGTAEFSVFRDMAFAAERL
jgi:hypothetical protein